MSPASGAAARPPRPKLRATRRPAPVAGGDAVATIATATVATATATGPALETELKFSLRGAAAIQRWPEALRLPSRFRLGPPREWLAEELYLDSPDLRLLRRGAACRLRFLDDGMVRVGLKALGNATGPRHERWELELPLEAGPAAAFDPAAWPAELRQSLAELLGEGSEEGAGRRPKRIPALAPLVALAHHRRRWPLHAAPEPAEPPGEGGAVSAVDAVAAGGVIDQAGVIGKGKATKSAKAAKASKKNEASEALDAPVLAELALDRVWARAPRRRGAGAGAGQPLTAFGELELERLAADGDAWTALEQAMEGAKGLRPQKRSKLERALRAMAEQTPTAPLGPEAAGSSPPTAGAIATGGSPAGATASGADAANEDAAGPARAGHPLLELPAGAAIRLVLRRPLLDLALAEAALRPHAAVEAVHRCRVAARRLSGLLRLLRPLLPRRLGRGRVWLALRELRSDLGAVRDRDVSLQQLAGWLGQGSDEKGAPPLGPEAASLQAAWAAERASQAAVLLDRLDGPERRRLYRCLRRWTDLDRTEAALRHGQAPLGPLLPELLAPRLAALQAGLAALGGGEGLGAGGPASGEGDGDDKQALLGADAPALQLHDLRLRGKGLRDALRPFRSGLTAEGLRALASLEAAVDHLGRLQDGAAAGQLLQDALLPVAFEAPLLAALAEEDLQLRAGLATVLQPLADPAFAPRLLEAWT